MSFVVQYCYCKINSRDITGKIVIYEITYLLRFLYIMINRISIKCLMVKY